MMLRVLVRVFFLLEQQSTYVVPRSAQVMNPTQWSSYPRLLSSPLRTYFCAAWLRSMLFCVEKTPAPPALKQVFCFGACFGQSTVADY